MRTPIRVALVFVAALANLATGQAQEMTKEKLIESLQCKGDQKECQAPPPPESRRRGFQAPAKRGISFEPFTKEEQDRIAAEAKAGKLPSADVEVFFDYDKADVTPAAQKTLAPLGQALSDPKLAANRFVLIGHTDAKGGEAYNQSLSERRAAAVKDYLVRTFGIAPERLVSYGRGKSLLKNESDPMAPENRRVQVVNHGAVAGAN